MWVFVCACEHTWAYACTDQRTLLKSWFSLTLCRILLCRILRLSSDQKCPQLPLNTGPSLWPIAHFCIQLISLWVSGKHLEYIFNASLVFTNSKTKSHQISTTCKLLTSCFAVIKPPAAYSDLFSHWLALHFFPSVMIRSSIINCCFVGTCHSGNLNPCSQVLDIHNWLRINSSLPPLK